MIETSGIIGSKSPTVKVCLSRALSAKTMTNGCEAEKGSDTNSRNGPKRASHYWCLTPFSLDRGQRIAIAAKHIHRDFQDKEDQQEHHR